MARVAWVLAFLLPLALLALPDRGTPPPRRRAPTVPALSGAPRPPRAISRLPYLEETPTREEVQEAADAGALGALERRVLDLLALGEESEVVPELAEAFGPLVRERSALAARVRWALVSAALGVSEEAREAAVSGLVAAGTAPSCSRRVPRGAVAHGESGARAGPGIVAQVPARRGVA